MDCASCAATVERALKQLAGVDHVDVDVVGGRVRVQYAPGSVERADLEGSIRRVGYHVEPPARAASARGEPLAARPFWARRGRIVMTVAAGVLLATGLILLWIIPAHRAGLVALALSTVAGGWFVVPRGVRAAMTRALDMNFLMSIAAVGAWLIGEPTEAAATLFLFSIAELLESYSMDRARHAIRALMDLAPAVARVRRGGGEVRVPVADVAVGEVVVVRPGEKLPTDGEVVEGRSSVNEAPITGESMPVDKEPGSEVFAGALNGQGVLAIRSTRPADDTTLARIIHAVEEAQASRAPSQTFVDRFARAYTPAVVVGALLVALVPPIVGAGPWETWIYRALAMLVVACPCALVISTPVTIVSGLTGAARAGVLIKGGAHLENTADLSAIAFDKTGTLTEGRPVVTDFISLDRASDAEVLRRALAVERHSEHPLAAAVLEYGETRGMRPGASTEFEALPGRGARAVVDGQPVFVGNKRMMDEMGLVSPDERVVLDRLEAEGKTTVVVSDAHRALAVLGIADRPRAEARAALSSLRALGIERIVMVTGDDAGTAAAVARTLGVADVRAELLPDDKVRVVRELAASGERIGFVGDGVNDAPALAASTVGIAMGAAGTDVALETADIALMGDDLSKLPDAIGFARRTMRIVRQNIVVALAIKIVFVVLAVGGWATLWMAVAADMGASLAVVLNGLRAMRNPAWRQRTREIGERPGSRPAMSVDREPVRP